MIKKFLISIIVILVVFVIFSISSNMFKNSPILIHGSVKKQIESTHPAGFTNYSEWLWSKGRTFLYDIIYMNIFSPGTAKFLVKDEKDFNGEKAYILEAEAVEGDLFKRIYDAQMTINSFVQRETKVSLQYQETSITPERKKIKKIDFYPEENIAEREGIKFKIPDNTYDPLSVFFNFLSREFKINEPIVLNLLSKEEIYEFKITPKSKSGDIYRLEGDVHRKDRSSTHGANFTIWVLDGQVRVPLLIKIVSAAGPIYLRLNSVK